jgi:RHS repeat-associated protein
MTHRDTPDGRWTFNYDGEDQLREAVGPNGREVYYYDHHGQRMLAVNQNGARFTFGASETRFDAAGKQVQRYVHIGDAGGTLARVETALKEPRSIELQYSDALQNMIVSLDERGRPVATFHYGAFGEVVHATGAANHNRHFNGKEEDASTGLRYYGARYYDPLILRWVTADPLYTFAPDVAGSEPARMNLYAFSLNNPVRYFDPDGQDPKPKKDKGHADAPRLELEQRTIELQKELMNESERLKLQLKKLEHQEWMLRTLEEFRARRLSEMKEEAEKKADTGIGLSVIAIGVGIITVATGGTAAAVLAGGLEIMGGGVGLLVSTNEGNAPQELQGDDAYFYRSSKDQIEKNIEQLNHDYAVGSIRLQFKHIQLDELQGQLGQ